MNEEVHERLAAKVAAHDLLLRVLYEKFALQEDLPRTRLSETIEGLVTILEHVAPPNTDFQGRVHEKIEQELRDFLRNVDAAVNTFQPLA